MRTLSAALAVELARVRNRGGAPAAVYLTRPHTDELLAEAGQNRDRRLTRQQQLSRFDGVPLYTDRDVSMIVWHDQACDAHTVLL